MMRLTTLTLAALMGATFSCGGGGDGGSPMPPTPSNPAPSLIAITPSAGLVGAAFPLTVNGAGFISSSTVQWNGSNRATTFVSGTQLTAAISASDVTAAGTASVTVVNPAPGGGTSSAATFTIATQYPIVEDLGAMRQNASVQGRDGLFSTAVGGQSYWTFGDTSLKAPNAAGKNFFNNSLAWTDSLDASHGIYLNHDYLDSSGAVTQFIPLTADEQQFNTDNKCTPAPGTTCGEEYALWNGPLIAVPNSNIIYTFYVLVQRGGSINGFDVIGSGIALWDRSTMTITRPVVAPGTSHPTLLWLGGPVYNDGALLEGVYVYAFGCKTNWIIKECRLGRALIEAVTAPSAWQYYIGDDNSGNAQWGADESAAATVFQGGAAGNSVFYNPSMQKYVAVYSGVFSNDVYYRTADHIWGPWSAQTKLFMGMPNTYDNTADYAAMAHSEFAEQNGNVQYIAYVHITGFLANEIRLVRVTFKPPGQ